MADGTKIEWTDATVNFWWGCTKVGPGCDHCYAETWSKRTGGNHWGVGVPRRKIASAVKTLHRLDNDHAWWAADCEIGQLHDHSRRRVFIQSMSDLFDNEVPAEWFDEAWTTIGRCNRLEIQIVTKRISFVEKRLRGRPWPKHAGLIISIVNQDEANRDIPRLLDLKARLGIPWVGLSMEPMLGPVDLGQLLDNCPVNGWLTWLDALDWVICGGESGPKARPMHPDWARALRDQCGAAGVPFFFKQWGEWFPGEIDNHSDGSGWCAYPDIDHDPSADRWEGRWTHSADQGGHLRVGKKRAGRRLDNQLHDGFPSIEQRNIDA
ncbi:protein gp37 [Sphingopyxis indica]|uniref:Protein gp37 n=2 Tax=Sphingopyxis indica TaxID=436663 RepID=A0A239H6V5_9SPHN|nr:phage Gp37/Gp68 family protein [Sphingopyxis indica]SNS76014.1 protein gp37 [Sphingopyxis indica]